MFYVSIMRDDARHVFQKPAEAYEARGRLDPMGFDRHVSFHTDPPPADLRPFVEHFWTIRWDVAQKTYRSEQVMHRPYVDVFVSSRDSGIQGTFRGRRTYLAAGRGRIVGVRFRPGAFHAFWDGALAELQDRIIDLKQVFPEADKSFIQHVSALDDQVAIDALLKLVRSKDPTPDANIELINAIIAAIETEESLNTVAAVADAFGKSERWLQQFFRDYVGIGLKWLMQRHRLLMAAEHIRRSDQPDWIGIAYDLGYSSQQHFITDFTKVLGKTPVRYKKDVTPV